MRWDVFLDVSGVVMISLNKIGGEKFPEILRKFREKGWGLCMLVHFGQWRVLWTGYWLKQWSYLEASTVGVVNWKEGAESKNATLWDERTDLMRSTAPHCAPCGVFHTLKLYNTAKLCTGKTRSIKKNQFCTIFGTTEYYSVSQYPGNCPREFFTIKTSVRYSMRQK